jgi:hypothetical protein
MVKIATQRTEAHNRANQSIVHCRCSRSNVRGTLNSVKIGFDFVLLASAGQGGIGFFLTLGERSEAVSGAAVNHVGAPDKQDSSG